MISGKQLAEAGYKYLGTPYSQMDCQAFVEQCLKDCGLNKNLAGSNAWFREVHQNGEILTPEECVSKYGKVPPGAFLFILSQDGKEPAKYKSDNLGNASHIGIATGKGEGAIHSSQSKGGVCESKFKGKTISGGWNKVGLWNQVELVELVDRRDGSSWSTDWMDQKNRPSGPPKAEEPKYAIVCSDNGNPVNTRKGPGKTYALSKAGKLNPGTPVQILKTQTPWCQIKVKDANKATWYCWIMETYLREVQPTAQPISQPPAPTTAQSTTPQPDQPQIEEGDETELVNRPRCCDHCRLCVPGCLCQQQEADGSGGVPS